jgi:hypothetical protein
MSPTIWTRCGGSSNLGRFHANAWRVVEAQHQHATLKLVDTVAEQEVLEELIDTVKRPRPEGARFKGLHYLLFTPFRHAPLRYGSRFGSRTERGIWYGADELSTSFAEVAYYRLLFLDGTTADLAPLRVFMSAFAAEIATKRGVDLSRPPFTEFRAQISSPLSYAESQPLGSQMRADGVEAFRFLSSRDPNGGTNIGLFEPAFVHPNPPTPETWICLTSATGAEFTSANVPGRGRYAFPRALFEIDGTLPSPGIGA